MAYPSIRTSPAAKLSPAPGEQIAALSHQLTLRPGDIIATGTPAGVGAGRGDSGEFLKPGDEVKIDVQYCGTLVNRMVAAS